jgi:hypothetical protein
MVLTWTLHKMTQNDKLAQNASSGLLSAPSNLNPGGVLLNQSTANITKTDEKQTIQFLRFLASSPGDLSQYISVLDKLIEGSSPETAQYLNQLRGKMQFNSEAATQTRNPQNGAAYASPQQEADNIAKMLEIKQGMMQGLKQMQAPAKPTAPVAAPQQPAVQQPAIQQPAVNAVTAQVIPVKKKTRGNPFKVLMGKVGKLLDHGLTKNKIVKYMSKEKYWDKEIIEKAVDIVKDYNRKKHRKAVTDMQRIIQAEAEEIETMEINLEILSIADLQSREVFLQNCVDGVDLGYEPKNPKKELSVVKRILESRNV